jgi:serine/threonine protein phosphatase PrpC
MNKATSAGSWKSWGESVVGRAHAREALPNQDAWLARHFPWGDVVALSDGLGSRRQAHLGSQAACMAVVEAGRCLQSHPSATLDDMLRFLHAWWIWLLAPESPTDCAATCLFAIRSGGVITLAQLGDGLIVACPRRQGQSVILADDKNNEFANITTSLGATHQLSEWRAARIPEDEFHGIVLCSDGISNDLMDGSAPEFANELVNAYRGSPAQIRQPHVRHWLDQWPVPGHTDDKTIACLYSPIGDPNV